MPVTPLDLQSIWSCGQSYADWCASIQNPHMRTEMDRYESEVAIPEALASKVKALKRPVHVLAIIEDWCGDVRRNAPMLAKLCALNPDILRLRCVDKKTKPELMVRYLTNSAEAIPIFVFFNDTFVEVGNWGPRPAECKRVMARGKAAGKNRRRAREDSRLLRRGQTSEHARRNLRVGRHRFRGRGVAAMSFSAGPSSRSRVWQLFTGLLPYAALIFIFGGMGGRDLLRMAHVDEFGQHDLQAIFCTKLNLYSMAIDSAPFIVAAAGMTLVMLTGGIDLSVGSIIGVASAVACRMANRHQSAAFGMACGVGAGMLCGMVNGTLVVALRVQPFIVTLGALMSLRGVCRLVNMVTENGASIFITDGVEGAEAKKTLMSNFIWPASTRVPFLDIPLYIPIAAAAVGVLWIVLDFTRLGRKLYAVGSNEEAARLSGVSVSRTKLWAYTIAGMMAGIAGVMNASRLRGSSAETGFGAELTIIAAVVIGGTSLSGGQGTISGCVIGVVLMNALSSACTSLQVPDAWQMAIIGLFLIAAAAVDRLRREKAG